MNSFSPIRWSKPTVVVPTGLRGFYSTASLAIPAACRTRFSRGEVFLSEVRRLLAVRLIAVDIDGTLVNSQSRITPANRTAIRKALELGIAVVLVTGRRFRTSAPVALELGLDLPIVCHNGALIRHGITGMVEYHRTLPTEPARAAASIALDLGVEPIAHYALDGEGRAVVGRSPGLRSAWVSDWIARNADVVDEVDDIRVALADEPTALTLPLPGSQGMRLQGLLQRTLAGSAQVFEASYPELGISFLDVVHLECSKASGLRLIADRLGIGSSEIMAVGDNYNDLPVLESAGIPVVMGNAPDELKRLGFHTVPSNDEDGLAAAIKAFVLRTRPN